MKKSHCVVTSLRQQVKLDYYHNYHYDDYGHCKNYYDYYDDKYDYDHCNYDYDHYDDYYEYMTIMINRIITIMIVILMMIVVI